MTLFLVAALRVLWETFVGASLLLALRRGGAGALGWKDLPVAFLLGLTLETGLLGAWILGGLSLGAAMRWTGSALTLVGIGLMIRHRGGLRGGFGFPVWRRLRWYEGAALAILAEKAAFGLWNIHRLPNFFSDAMVQWGGRGRAIFGGVNFSTDPASAQFLGHVGRNSYPLGAPLWEAGNAWFAGGWSDPAALLHGLFFYGAILGLVWGAGLALTGSRPLAAAGAVIVAVHPLTVWHIAVGFNDIAVAAFTLAALIALVRREWFLAGLLAAGAAWQKNEGLLMVIPALAFGAAWMGEGGRLVNSRGALRYLAGAMAILPWLLYKLAHGLPIAGAHGQEMVWDPAALMSLVTVGFLGATGGGFWMLWPLFLLLLAPDFLRSGTGRGALGVALAMAGMWFLLFGLTTLSEFVANQMTVHRVLFQFLPAALVILFVGISDRGKGSSTPGTVSSSASGASAVESG